MEADAQLMRTAPPAGESGAIQQQLAATLQISSIADDEAKAAAVAEWESETAAALAASALAKAQAVVPHLEQVKHTFNR